MKSKSVLILLLSIFVAALGQGIFSNQNTKAQEASDYSFSYRTDAGGTPQIFGQLNPSASDPLGYGNLTFDRNPSNGQSSTTTEYFEIHYAGLSISVNNCGGGGSGTYNGSSQISIGGTPNTYPCNTNPSENGDLQVTVNIANLGGLANPEDYGPLIFRLLDPSGSEIDSLTVATNLSELPTSGSISDFLTDIPAGSGYSVEVSVSGIVVDTIENINIEAGFTESVTLDTTVAVVTDTVDQGVAEGEDLAVDCEGVSFTNLGWVLCPVIEGLERATSFMYRVVKTELALFTEPGVSDQAVNDRAIDISTNSGAYAVWQGFRNLARGLMVIALLVIIYAQLIGTSVVDAYNVRRMLPKFVIAVIGVELSWFIFTEFAVLVEEVARGIPDLVLSATGLNIDNSIPITVDSAWLGGLGLAGVGIYAGLVYATSGGILFSLIPIALSVAFAMLVAFVVLVLRRVILITLLILAPVALVLWVIPGTEKLFGKWFNLYQNLLFMYPLIQLLVVAGIVISQIAGDVQISGSMTFEQVILALTAIVAYFAPYFMIPLTFKWAGGAVSSIAGMVNDRSKGLIDRGKGWAEGQRAGRTERARSEGRAREARARATGQSPRLRDRVKSGRLIGPLFPKGYTARTRGEQSFEALEYNRRTDKLTDPASLAHQEALLKSRESQEAFEIAKFQLAEREPQMQQEAGGNFKKFAGELAKIAKGERNIDPGDAGPVDIQVRRAAANQLSKYKQTEAFDEVVSDMITNGDAQAQVMGRQILSETYGDISKQAKHVAMGGRSGGPRGSVEEISALQSYTRNAYATAKPEETVEYTDYALKETLRGGDTSAIRGLTAAVTRMYDNPNISGRADISMARELRNVTRTPQEWEATLSASSLDQMQDQYKDALEGVDLRGLSPEQATQQARVVIQNHYVGQREKLINSGIDETAVQHIREQVDQVDIAGVTSPPTPPPTGSSGGSSASP